MWLPRFVGFARYLAMFVYENAIQMLMWYKALHVELCYNVGGMDMSCNGKFLFLVQLLKDN